MRDGERQGTQVRQEGMKLTGLGKSKWERSFSGFTKNCSCSSTRCMTCLLAADCSEPVTTHAVASACKGQLTHIGIINITPAVIHDIAMDVFTPHWLSSLTLGA